ncbi:two-component sensor histidine kinase [Undibacterium sp. YM2]|jgi:two-component system sensor histidine kinase QseC|uniref:ATP-binding protein n=1 Tax=Undibacterium sp. YM2 TaxID=2058625 RepID=UPI001331D818|nr:ATP-binding protein [Undibacterium sp. YM2]BBB64479.1 two-component sensor histidine kinase [Undibacterium sp. YM2]
MTARPSLKNRLLILTLTAVASIWLLATAITWFDAKHELDEVLDGHLAQAASLLATHQIHEIVENGESQDTHSLHKYAPKVMYQVFHSGQLGLRSANAPETPILDVSKELKEGFTSIQIGSQQWRVFYTIGADADVQVYVAEEVQARTAILYAVLRSLVLPFIIALPLLAIALWLAVRQGMSPIVKLGQVLEQRQPSAVNPIEMNGTSKETQPVIQALNGLLERIAGLMESERRFTADAAHELRTPLAALRTQAQVAMVEHDETKRQHALKGTLEACDRTSRLIEQLLTLSRLESNAEAEFVKFDIAVMIRSQIADIAHKAISKHQSLELDADCSCVIDGNEVLLGVLVRNLLDNAIRYCPEAARILIQLSCINSQYILTIEDSGNGLSDQDISRLGERFFRIQSNVESGSGLGWSIAKRIAAVHNMDLQAGRSEKLEGLKVTLTIPVHY